MESNYSWSIIDFNDNKADIKGIYTKVAILKNYPAANHWQYLFPILENFFDKDKSCFAVLNKGDQPFFILPLSMFLVKKFFFSWYEIGYPFHRHINLIKLPKEILDNHYIVEDLINTVKKKYGNHWSRFTIRNIESRECEHEYSGDVSYFKTDKELLISDIISKKHLRNIKRLSKKLSEDVADIEFSINSPSLSESIDDFSEFENKSWKGINGVAINSSPKLLSTYKEFADNFSSKHMFVAKISSKDIVLSSVVGFHLGTTIFIHKISHNDNYSTYSPGNILILKLLEHSIESKDIDILNLVTSPEWAKRWHPMKSNVINIVHFNKNNSGRLLNILIFSWRKYKPLFKRILRIN
jgi:hypothetical protein